VKVTETDTEERYQYCGKYKTGYVRLIGLRDSTHEATSNSGGAAIMAPHIQEKIIPAIVYFLLAICLNLGRHIKI